MRPSSPVLLAIFVAFTSPARAFDYIETFDGHADLSPASAAGWKLLTDTSAPQTISADFSINDDLNVTKLTRANDDNSLFGSAYFYHEHDIATGESTLSGNLAGQDAGDFLLTTSKPASRFGASGIDLRGATFSIDYQHSSKVFWFAIILDDGSKYVVDDAIGTSPGAIASSNSNPINTSTTEFRRILKISDAPGQQLRYEDLRTTLSEAQLSNVREVGIYCATTAAGAASRFDNFRLEGYGLSAVTSASITHTRSGRMYIDEADPDAFEEYATTSFPKFSAQTGQLVSVDITASADWTGGYSFTNDAAGAAGDASFTPHPFIWLQTRLPDSWSFDMEETLAAQLQRFAAGNAGIATDTASGKLASSAVAPLDQVDKFVGSGSTTLDLELRNDSLYQNLSSTPASGTFVRSISADYTLTVTYNYIPAATGDGVIFVKHDATGANDGSSWSDAFTDFQSAIAAAQPGNEIWVAAGSYTPDAPGGDRGATFNLRGGVSWYGGFNGTETSREQRDPVLNETTLSGDLNGDDGGGTGINARWTNMIDNSYSVVTGSNLLLPCDIDGFTITRGSFSSLFSGSGINLTLCADVRVSRCRFIGNISGSAAGMLTSASKTTVLDCHFEDNYSFDGRGGAIYHSGDWQDRNTSYVLTIHDTTFLANRASSGAGSASGGALYSSFEGAVEIDRCLFENNRADWRFTYGSYTTYGGAALIFGKHSRIANTTFRGNRAQAAGAIWIARDTQLVNCRFIKNEAFRQSVEFYDYGGFAGAVYAPGGASTLSTAVIDHCTFHANTARNVGGIWGNPSLTISNSILYTNTSTEAEATLLDQQLNGDPIIRNSCVKGLPVLDNGNIDSDPIFVDQDGADNLPGTADDDLRLNNGSPCIDSGDDSAFFASMPALDFDGLPRYQDDPLSAGNASDMGAYEFVPGSGTLPENALPSASFTYVIGSANEVTFTDTSTDSDGSIVQWNWNLGDGNSSATHNPVHTYATNGTYAVTLVVRDDQNGTDLSVPATITVSGLTTGSVSTSSPASGARVSGIVPLSVDATPDIVRVKLYIDGIYTNQKDTSSPFSIDWDSTTVADGQHTIEFKTNDDTDTDEGVFWTAPISVLVQNTIPTTPLESWRELHFTGAELGDPGLETTVWGVSADADDDGLTNDTEFALGTNPHDGSDSDGGIAQTLVSDPSGSLLVLTFLRRNDDPDLTAIAELSYSLTGGWGAAKLEVLSAIDQGNGYERVTAREVPTLAQRKRAFTRVIVTRSAP